MKVSEMLRGYWQEILLFLLVAIPWLSLLALGMVWLWQGGYVLDWAVAAAALGLLAWPLLRSVQRRANKGARLALGDLAEPSRAWNVVEREAWAQVLTIADSTAPFSFTQMGPLLVGARETIDAVAHRFHPEATTAWGQFSLPEALLLAERLCRDVRREAIRHIPGIRATRLSHLLWVQRQNERYGQVAQMGWRVGFGLWRLARAALNPLQAAAQETGSMITEKTTKVLSYRLRAYATRLLVLEVGRAAIDLYSGRLALSDDEMRAASRLDMSGAERTPLGPVRILMVGQVNAGKSSLLNALAQEIRGTVGPVPTTTQAVEHRIEQEGRPTVTLVDMPGLDERNLPLAALLTQVARADLVIWVASATQPARGPDRKGLDDVRAWAAAQLARHPQPILLALTHVDQLRPAAEWAPPYDIMHPAGPKARTIRDALDVVARTLQISVDRIVPVAMPPNQKPYNLEALWARMAIELDEAKLVQLDRLRNGHKVQSLHDLANQLGNAGRLIMTGIIKG